MSQEMTAEKILELETAHIVIAVYQKGGHDILKGEDILKDIAASGKSERLLTMHVPVVNTTQAEIIAAALNVIEEGKMTEQVAENAAAMFHAAKDRDSLVIDDDTKLDGISDGSHRQRIISRLLH
jgi:hypothetical protein